MFKAYFRASFSMCSVQIQRLVDYKHKRGCSLIGFSAKQKSSFANLSTIFFSSFHLLKHNFNNKMISKWGAYVIKGMNFKCYFHRIFFESTSNNNEILVAKQCCIELQRIYTLHIKWQNNPQNCGNIKHFLCMLRGLTRLVSSKRIDIFFVWFVITA